MDWKIKIEWCKELEKTERYAEVSLFPEEKSATIRVLPIELWGDDWKKTIENGDEAISRYMIEPCIAHEMIHIEFFFIEPYMTGKVLPLFKEQSVDILANALVEAKYEVL